MADPKQQTNDQLLLGLQNTDPRLYEYLKRVKLDIQSLYNQIFPIQQFVTSQTAASPIPNPVLTFTATVGPNYILLNWTSDDPNIRFYEIRRGTDWDTATFITRTTTLSATLDPLVVGPYTFLIKTLNDSGIFQSADPVSVSITVTAPNSPILTGQVIDNNVLLYWTPGAITSFAIKEYKVYKNAVFYGRNTGTFITIFETLPGEYDYSVSAVDLAGNESVLSNITLDVNQPPDFQLQFELTSTFNGTKVNCFVDAQSGDLYVVIDTNDTWAQHFTNNGWDQIDDQLAAGFPYYLQPGDASNVGSYQEQVDFGVVLNNTIFSVLPTVEQLVGTTLVTCQIDYKVLIGDPWTAAPAGFAAFIPSARYIRVTLTFTSSNTTAIMVVTNLLFIANVKQEIDSGQKSALASDASGTVVTFNKAFIDVKSITAEVKQTEPYDVVVDFVDTPNPTEFKVLVFDSSGIRRDSLVYWKARGIV